MNEPLQRRHQEYLEANTAYASQNAPYIEFRMHVAPLESGVRIPQNPDALARISEVVSKFLWHPKGEGPLKDDSFSLVSGRESNLYVHRDGTFEYHRLFHDPPAARAGKPAVPFPELFGDTYGLLLVAEAAYLSLANYHGQLYIGQSIVNIFDRELALPKDMESFFAGDPVRHQSQTLSRCIFDADSMTVGEDPIVVTRRLMGNLFWRMGYRSYEPYLRLWGRAKNRAPRGTPPDQRGAQPENEGRPAPELPESYLTTILFTDIVGSTAQKARLGDHAWLELLARHDAIVRECVTRYGGQVIKHTGDGFVITFSSPTRAVLSAIEAVESVRELGLSIRAGLHAGECEVTPGDVIGIAVDTASRIMSVAAEGNEVLVSSTVRDLSRGLSVSRGLHYEDRGVHALKGIGDSQLFSATRSPGGPGGGDDSR